MTEWSRLLASDSPDRARVEIARWLGPGASSIALTPDELLAVWLEARQEILRSEARLAARSHELDLLQTLGRCAAEAGSAAELFDATAAVLHGGHTLDLVVAGFEEEGAFRLLGYPARPFTDRCTEAVAQRAARFLGWPGAALHVELRRSGVFDAAREARDAVLDEELILLPVVRRGRPVACLLVVPGGVPDESRLRVLYSATNQLSLHLDRILTVREAEADRFRAIVDSMPQGVLLADARLRLREANRSAREMLAAAGLRADVLDALVERLGLGELVASVLAGRAPLAEAEVGVAGDRLWSVTVSPMRGGRRRIDGLVIVLGDVSERRRLQVQLSRAEKMSSLGRLLAGVAHELNNPLASILGYAQLLGSRVADDQLGERLMILRREAERCRRIVENLLSFARQRETEVRPVSLNQVVQNVVTLLQYQLRVAAIGIEIRSDPDLPAVRGDAHQLEQVLVNLLTNARYALQAARRPGTIELRTARRGKDGVELTVRDDGPGIPDAIRAKIFDPFFTTKPVGEGTGLGLALVSEIITAHGGVIEVEPAPGGGSVFRIVLPACRPERAPAPPAPLAGKAAYLRGRILVVDDEAPLAKLICDALSEDGHRVESVPDGRQALARLDRERFDLVISDVRMPGMDGDELSLELRSRSPALRGGVLLTTGDTLDLRPRDAGSGSGSGRDVLEKPFDLDDLRRAVRERLGPIDA